MSAGADRSAAPAAAISTAPDGTRQGALTVYYDGACPLCQREVGMYRRMSGERICWVDIAQSDDALVAPDLPRAAAATRLHARLPDGRLVSGPGAFAETWSRLAYLGWLGRVARAPIVQRVLDPLYRIFLRLRPALQALARPPPASSRT